MLPRRFRLPAAVSFHHQITLFTPYVTCKLSNNQLPNNRYGFVVSKRVDKRASKRNEIKRKVRQCIEAQKEQIKTGYDMLVIVKPSAIDAVQTDICQTLYQAMVKEQLL